jgi:2-oxoglutarate ferredoxin oxidoreductase subunit alpha
MLQCRFGSHGDYSVIALCPASVQEMFDLTVDAFNLAERFRVPVFLMADEIIGHMRERLIIPDSVVSGQRVPLEQGALPFRAGEDLVPGFPTFGMGYGVHVTGLTHDERGYPCATSPKLHEDLVKRLVSKIEGARDSIASYDMVNPEAETVFVSYGAPSRSVQQVLHDHPGDGIGHLRLKMVWPFAESLLSRFKNAETFIVPEQNLGQISREIERHVDGDVIPVPKLGGDLHTPDDLYRVLAEVR